MGITKYTRSILAPLAAALILSTPLAALAQVYGSGTYGSCSYSTCTKSGGGTNSGGGSNVSLGPISLPITGPGAWATWGTVAMILAAMLFYWALTHRRKRKAQVTTRD